MDYDKEIDIALSKKIIKKEDIFDFRETPLEEIFNDMYIFSNEFINLHSSNLNLNSVSFLFYNSTTINACARILNFDYGIFINSGLMMHCIENYLKNYSLKKNIEEIFYDLGAKLEFNINEVAFHLVTQFTFYHEFAHLIQFKEKEGSFMMQERSESEDSFDFTKHKLEINADSFASICIATHILDYIENIKNEELIFNILKIFSSFLLDYIISLTNELQIYFDEKNHPHPLIRLLNIIVKINTHLEETLFKKISLNLNTKELLNETLNFYNLLIEKDVFTKKFNNLIDNNIEFKNEIVEYTFKISDFDVPNYVDSMKIWNSYFVA